MGFQSRCQANQGIAPQVPTRCPCKFPYKEPHWEGEGREPRVPQDGAFPRKELGQSERRQLKQKTVLPLIDKTSLWTRKEGHPSWGEGEQRCCFLYPRVGNECVCVGPFTKTHRRKLPELFYLSGVQLEVSGCMGREILLLL